MGLYNKGQLELLDTFANQSDKLFSLGIIKSDSFTGEIGEYIASEYFDLERETRSNESVDAIGKDGSMYQIKSKKSEALGYSITNLDISKIDFLVIVYFERDYTPNKIIRIAAKHLPSNKVNISQKFLRSVEHDLIRKSEILIPRKMMVEINQFGEIYKQLKQNGVIATSRLVGDIGEFYACYYLGLTKADSTIQKGFDAVDIGGNTFGIKTRRVYESGRRKSNTRRISNLEGKTAQTLCVVILDRNFRCDGLWTMPMGNINNKKSATLRIVCNTEGVVTHVPSKVDWLNNNQENG